MSDGRSTRTVDPGAIEKARQEAATGGSLIRAVEILDAGGFAIDILGPEHIAALLNIDTELIMHAVRHGLDPAPEQHRWHDSLGAAQHAYLALRPHRRPDQIRTPATMRTTRPRGRRARHVARATSSSDSGDDGGSEPPAGSRRELGRLLVLTETLGRCPECQQEIELLPGGWASLEHSIGCSVGGSV